MTTIKAFVIGGRLELEVPANWPDGTEVEIQPVKASATVDSDVLSPSEIAETLRAMEQIEPFEMTDEELSVWEAERRNRKESEKASFFSRAEQLRRAWE